jgi:hypothetical protein
MEGVGRRGIKRDPFGGRMDSGSRTGQRGCAPHPLAAAVAAQQTNTVKWGGYPNPKRHLLYDGRGQVISTNSRSNLVNSVLESVGFSLSDGLG